MVKRSGKQVTEQLTICCSYFICPITMAKICFSDVSPKLKVSQQISRESRAQPCAPMGQLERSIIFKQNSIGLLKVHTCHITWSMTTVMTDWSVIGWKHVSSCSTGTMHSALSGWDSSILNQGKGFNNVMLQQIIGRTRVPHQWLGPHVQEAFAAADTTVEVISLLESIPCHWPLPPG